MEESTRRAIIALLAVDATATADERNRVSLALANTWRAVSVAAASRMLGVTRPTIYRLVRDGMLSRAADGRISEQSIERYLRTGAELPSGQPSARRGEFFMEGRQCL